MSETHVHLPPPLAGRSEGAARGAPFVGHFTQPHPSLSLHAKSGAFGFISPSRLRSRLSHVGPEQRGQFTRPPRGRPPRPRTAAATPSPPPGPPPPPCRTCAASFLVRGRDTPVA